MPALKLLAPHCVTPSKAQSAGSRVRATAFALSCALSATLFTVTASAAPTVVNNNQTDQATTAPQDPQVAPQPATPFKEINPQNPTETDAANNNPANNNPAQAPNALENPNSLASEMQPSDSDLSAANQELLSRNAQLQRDVNDLETRVNVLINERSGQLFMYGAVTMAVSLFLGVLLGGFIFSRRDRW
ncbi:hypothetical protein [Psychrobacter sanguinis]|uniref:hypothetical protein n=1 Tax=Psychrobacter sanguinis TaxID=861445 RepID=UPI00020C65B7|nr:hypothetical protein [Psychrobacter sanguinis]EGK08650.1 hypothetical protein HMPREF9373_2313 [Psychrobacter sp. 1501(2011)]MCC3306907.1 hypothetical protein [Psychrobacter sanguinis]MCD9152217.1 hypothetical protein [Psychrobacter sanguinis]UEC26761.1 hypothetical protein LK453_06680 [Psychrobacter sanguinis]